MTIILLQCGCLICGQSFFRGEKVVRGCQKRIVYLKSTGSEVFSDAYFVVRDGALADVGECDMVKEANRILDECVALDATVSRGRVFLDLIKAKLVPFFIGMSVGILIVTLIK